MNHIFTDAIELLKQHQAKLMKLCLPKALTEELDQGMKLLKEFCGEWHLGLTRAEVSLARQWFDAVQDLNPGFLTYGDADLAKDLYESLNIKVPRSVLELAATRPPAPISGQDQNSNEALLARIAALEEQVRLLSNRGIR